MNVGFNLGLGSYIYVVLWEILVRPVESVDGGMTQNSSPKAIMAMRDLFLVQYGRISNFYGAV